MLRCITGYNLDLHLVCGLGKEEVEAETPRIS
jgi:hypothetical protein